MDLLTTFAYGYLNNLILPIDFACHPDLTFSSKKNNILPNTANIRTKSVISLPVTDTDLSFFSRKAFFFGQAPDQK